MKKSTKNIAAGICAAAVFAAGFFGCSKKDAAKKETEIETVYAVNTYRASPGSLDDYLEFGGDVQTASSIDIYPDTAGKVSRIYVSVGQVVQKDQILAEVDASKPGMIYSASPVRASVGGTVTSFPLNIGATVSPQAPMGKISSTGRLEVKTNVAERFISRLALNQAAIITFDAYPGEKFPAQLVEINPVLDPSSRTLGIKLLQYPPDSRLRAGMYAKIKLITDSKQDIIVIPDNVIITRNDETFVFIADEETKTARRVPVKMGIRVDNKQEILDGINPGDLVIIKGQSLLNDGSKVNIVSISE
ncbi:MAG: efflux RND transporter periplasmic adaptor subunit [Bacteroides sp.]|nr:efflux RND transporter periplasmic adaptor subunit [Prevotella sp.]MCM1407752.1 efflux RND transporter periplasmic adaptor subunit [Treponema brennaborense]MCM1469098.1 efflux RND transporter periplasmic adaptor subunit [Bacteroides sp.]